FKPSHDEINELYGLDVHELNVWRPLIEHAQEHLASGRMISTESDAYWLPDTSGTDYRTNHVKTTIVLNELDLERKRLGYFHNASYHALEGEDFEKTFRLGVAHDPTFLPLFAEFIRTEGRVKRPEAELAAMSFALWRKHARLIPRANPVRKFQQRFE